MKEISKLDSIPRRGHVPDTDLYGEKREEEKKKVTSVGLEYQTTLDFFDQFDPSQKAWFTGFISVLGYNIYQKVVEHVQLLRCQTRIYSSEYNRTPAVEIIPDQMNWEWLMKWFNIWG